MDFKTAYENWLNWHMSRRTGERLRRLQEGHGHGERLYLENTWWPAVGSFDYLHPEYGVYDFRDGIRYLDFAYLRPPYKVNQEIDSFGSHNRDDKWKHSDDLRRQNDLVLDGWTVLRFSYEDVRDRPRQCQRTIQQMLGTLYGVGAGGQSFDSLPVKQREVLRLAIRSEKPITPEEVSLYLGVSVRNALAVLHQMRVAGLIEPASGSQRVTSYRLGPGFNKYPLFR